MQEMLHTGMSSVVTTVQKTLVNKNLGLTSCVMLPER